MPSVIKICIALTFVYFIGELAFRFVYLQGLDSDLEHFTSYVSVAILLVISDQAMKRFLLRAVKETALSFSARGQADQLHEVQKTYHGYLYGGLLPIVRWPLVLVTVIPIAALWGQKWADRFEGVGPQTAWSRINDYHLIQIDLLFSLVLDRDADPHHEPPFLSDALKQPSIN